jgi:hypothetical protein
VIPQIGLLDPGVSSLFAAFQQGMRDLRYIGGQTVSYLHVSAEGRPGCRSRGWTISRPPSRHASVQQQMIADYLAHDLKAFMSKTINEADSLRRIVDRDKFQCHPARDF